MISQTNIRLQSIYDITNSFVNAEFPTKGSSKRHQWILEIEVLFLCSVDFASMMCFKGKPKENMSASNKIATLCPMDLDYLVQWL